MEQGRKSGNKTPIEPGLARETPPDRITLSDGKEYTLAPLNLNMLCEVEQRFETENPLKKIMDGKLSTIRFLLYLRLHENYPDITEEQIGKLVTWLTLTDIFKKATGAI